MEIKTLDEIKSHYYGEKGTPKRDQLESELEALRIGLKIREARQKMDMTQEELAKRVNKKRPFISKAETDGSNITLKSLFEIVEKGLGGKLNIIIDVPEHYSDMACEPQKPL